MHFIIRLIRVLSIVSIIMGALMKIQHWPLANFLLPIGAITLAGTFIVDFVIEEINLKKQKLR